MLVYNTDQYPLVTITFAESTWRKEIHDKTMSEMTALLEGAIARGERIRLLISGNAFVENPPLIARMWFIAYILREYPKFNEGIERTAIWKPDCKMDFFFDVILSMYTPARPLKICTIYEEALQWVLS